MSYTPRGRLSKAIVAILERERLPDPEVARRVGTSRQRVEQVRVLMGLPATPKPPTYDATALVRAYVDGASTRDISARFAVSGSTILKLLHRADVPLRPTVNRPPSPSWVVRALRTANWRWCNVCLAAKYGTRRLNVEQLRFRLIHQGVIPHHRLPRGSTPCRPGCKRAPRAVVAHAWTFPATRYPFKKVRVCLRCKALQESVTGRGWSPRAGLCRRGQ